MVVEIDNSFDWGEPRVPEFRVTSARWGMRWLLSCRPTGVDFTRKFHKNLQEGVNQWGTARRSEDIRTRPWNINIRMFSQLEAN